MAGTGFFSGSSIQGRVKNWLLMVFRWSSACLWNSINRYLKASFFHAPHFIYFHSMNLTSQSCKTRRLIRWLSCSKIICNYIYISNYLTFIYKKKQMLENTGQQNFEKTRSKIDLEFFFSTLLHRNVVLYVEYLINADLNYPELFKSSCHTVGLPLFHVLSCWWLHPKLECPKLPHSLAQLIEQDSFSVVLNHPAPINNKDNKKTVLQT